MSDPQLRQTTTALAMIIIICLCSTVVSVSGRNVETARQKRTTENRCDNVKSFFQSRNIPMYNHDSPRGNICGGHCCGADGETLLRKQSQEVFGAMLRHNSRSLQGLLNSTAATLQSHITELAYQSENKTLVLFSQVFRGRSVLSRDAIGSLYLDLRRYVQINQDAFTTAPTNIDLVSSVMRFFTDMFPLMYHHIAGVPKKDFAFEYKQCLKEAVNNVMPFGDIPRQVSQSLSKSMDATTLLLQAFGVGLEVLNATDSLVTEDDGKSNVECHDALMKMTHCTKCNGLKEDVKPCSGYCLNVMRGCLTKHVAELDSPWNGYVEGMERLVTAVRQHNNEAGVNADAVIRGLDTRISEAIMHAMEKSHDIDIKVKRTCGQFKLSEKEDPSVADLETATESGLSIKQRMPTRQFTPPPEQMSHFLNSIGKTRGFYGNLADSLCQDESFAETKDQHCWNGERIGEYTKTVVDAGLNMQKYNPEVKPGTNLQNIDSRVANLADKLRHVHQMVTSSLAGVGAPESDNFMQGDGADGSGSGSGPDITDDDDDNIRGSGSGNGPYGKESYPEITDNTLDKERGNTHTTESGSAYCNPSTTLLLITLAWTAVALRFT